MPCQRPISRTPTYTNLGKIRLFVLIRVTLLRACYVLFGLYVIMIQKVNHYEPWWALWWLEPATSFKPELIMVSAFSNLFYGYHLFVQHERIDLICKNAFCLGFDMSKHVIQRIKNYDAFVILYKIMKSSSKTVQ